MKEYKIHIADFQVPQVRSDRRKPVFESIYNLRQRSDGGLEPYTGLGNSLGVTVSFVDWPFPQMYWGKVHGFVLTDTEITVFDKALTSNLLLTVSDTILWDMVDYSDFIVLCNGDAVYFCSGQPLTIQVAVGDKIPDVMSICDFKGILVGGGVLTNWYDCDAKSVIWSKVGQVDFVPDKMNYSGYYADPGLGDIQRVLPVEQGFIALGKEGVGFFQYTESGTFGFKKIHDYGIDWKGAAAADKQGVFFVNNESELWMTNGQEIEKLDYKWLLSNISEPLLTLNNHNNDLYISDENTSYVLSKNGFFSCYQSPTGIGIWNGLVYGCCLNRSDQSSLVRTASLDFIERGRKRFFDVHCGANNTDGHWGKGRWFPRYGRDSFMTLPYKPLSPDGYGFPLVTASEAKLELFWETKNTYVDFITFVYGFVDSHHRARRVDAPFT